jgi:hypothetical protein
VFITLTENQPIDWSFGDGVAQYAVSSDAAGLPSAAAGN